MARPAAPADPEGGSGMIPSTAHLHLRPGSAQVDASFRLTGDSHICCYVYPDRPPILSVTDAHVSVSVTVPDAEAVTPADLDTARRLADAIVRYIADLERHLAALPEGQETAA
jgi:hypothetical protein